jgi:hypothetical protein
MKELHELREMLCDELKEYGKKGELSTGSLDVVDKLTHTIKNLDKIMEEDGYSGYYPMHYYDDEMHRESYARGRGSNARRDSMGRYMSDGYSRGNLTDKLRDLMNEAPDDRTRMEIKRLIDKME